jgi:hypothetical protein
MKIADQCRVLIPEPRSRPDGNGYYTFVVGTEANPGFAQAVCPYYYLRTAICPLSTLLSAGPGTCLAGTS